MKISDYKRLSFFENIDANYEKAKVNEPYVENSSVLQNMLDEIFCVDPISGLPKGDIQYYLSMDANPDVRLWLENNLLAPRAKQSGSSIEGVTDDLIEEMTRKAGESYFDYSRRLVSVRDSAMAEIEKFKSVQPNV